MSTLRLKRKGSKTKIPKGATITDVIAMIAECTNVGDLASAKRLFVLAKAKWGKKFTKYYPSKTTKKVSNKTLTKTVAKSALNKKKKANANARRNAREKRNMKTTSFKAGEVLVPIYDVWISGTKLSLEKKNLITSLNIKETVDGADTATINIVDPDFDFIEDNIFMEDNFITIKLGWGQYTHRCTFKGYITVVDIDFSSDGRPTLTLNCKDRTHKMDKKEVSKTWKKKSSKQIVKAICKKYGFKAKFEKGYKFKKKTVTQSSQTDIAFIQKLAQDETRPFTARLVDKTFYYMKKGVIQDAKVGLTYKAYPADLISFSPRINKTTKTKTTSGSTDTKKKQGSSTGTSGSKGTTPSVKPTKKPGSGSSGSSGNGRTRDVVNGVWR